MIQYCDSGTEKVHCLKVLRMVNLVLPAMVLLFLVAGPPFSAAAAPFEKQCQTIKKNATPSTPASCVEVCFVNGDLTTAHRFENGEDCSGTVTPITVQDPAATAPNLMLCVPCGGEGKPSCTCDGAECFNLPFTDDPATHKCDILQFADADIVFQQGICFRSALTGKYMCSP